MPTHDRPATATLVRGGVAGMVAGAVMAMFAMTASVTYQHHGFFTPLLHMSALVGSPDTMMRSVSEAMAGHRFWLAGGPAATGLAIHMVTSAMFGVAFAMVARRVRRGGALVAVGAAFGLVAFAASALVGLPLAAAVTGAGSTISDMAGMVGWATFAVEHVLFGLVLGVVAMRSSAEATPGATRTDGARSAMLAR